MVTLMGGLWFAWLYIEWRENLWVPIWLHILMNFAWGLFDVSDNAMGGMGANVFRIMTIVITIVVTSRFNRKHDRFRINRKNLLINSKPSSETHT